MMKKTILMAMVVVLVTAGTAEGQRRGGGDQRGGFRQGGGAGPALPEVGVRGSYDFDRRDFGVGGQVVIPFTRALSLNPSGDYFFGDAENSWQANADVAVNLRVLRGGLGLAVVDSDFVGDPESDDPELGLNLFAGIHSPARRSALLRPFVEARWTFLEDDTPFRLSAGVNLRVGFGDR